MGRAKLTPREEALKPIIAANIKKYLNDFNKKPADLQRGTDIAQSTISDYTSGKTLINPGNVEKISSFFGVLKSDIDPRFGDDWANENEFPIIDKTVEIMKKLEEPRQKVVLDTSSSELADQKKQAAKKDNTISIYFDNVKPKYETLVVHGLESAGDGYWQEDEMDIEVQIPADEIPDEFDDLALVIGDSMRPKLHNGDVLFIKFTRQIEIGQIGVFRTSRGNFVKKLQNGFLESLNPNYDDVYFSEADEAEAIGVVVDYYRK